MIEIEAVQPNAREFRPMRRGWGLIHWACLVPSYAYLVGFLAFGVLAGSLLPEGLFFGAVVGSWLLSLLGAQWLKQVTYNEQRKAPTSSLPWRWRIDDEGLSFDNGLQTNRVDWRGVKIVQEERDRFLFLVTPAYNPVLPKRLMTAEQVVALKALIADVTASGRLGRGVD